MKEIRCIQGSPEWWALRRGIPTASEFGRIITPAKAEYATGAEGYIAEVMAASLGWESSFKGTPDTERGNYLEGEARRWLFMRYGMQVRDAGFCISDCGQYGASPDGMLEDGTPVEIKCPDLHTFIRWALKRELPLEHKAQVHGEMWVTGASRCIFTAYTDTPEVDNLMIEVRRDDFTEKLGKAVGQFNRRMLELQNQLIEEPESFRAKIAAARQAVINSLSQPTPSKPETLAQTMNRTAREIRQGQ